MTSECVVRLPNRNETRDSVMHCRIEGGCTGPLYVRDPGSGSGLATNDCTTGRLPDAASTARASVAGPWLATGRDTALAIVCVVPPLVAAYGASCGVLGGKGGGLELGVVGYITTSCGLGLVWFAFPLPLCA